MRDFVASPLPPDVAAALARVLASAQKHDQAAAAGVCHCPACEIARAHGCRPRPPKISPPTITTANRIQKTGSRRIRTGSRRLPAAAAAASTPPPIATASINAALDEAACSDRRRLAVRSARRPSPYQHRF